MPKITEPSTEEEAQAELSELQTELEQLTKKAKPAAGRSSTTRRMSFGLLQTANEKALARIEVIKNRMITLNHILQDFQKMTAEAKAKVQAANIKKLENAIDVLVRDIVRLQFQESDERSDVISLEERIRLNGECRKKIEELAEIFEMHPNLAGMNYQNSSYSFQITREWIIDAYNQELELLDAYRNPLIQILFDKNIQKAIASTCEQAHNLCIQHFGSVENFALAKPGPKKETWDSWIKKYNIRGEFGGFLNFMRSLSDRYVMRDPTDPKNELIDKIPTNIHNIIDAVIGRNIKYINRTLMADLANLANLASLEIMINEKTTRKPTDIMLRLYNAAENHINDLRESRSPAQLTTRQQFRDREDVKIEERLFGRIDFSDTGADTTPSRRTGPGRGRSGSSSF